jgi:hypothetical protein
LRKAGKSELIGLRGYIYIPCDEKRSTVAGRTQREEEEQRVEYRECPSCVGYIAGSDGSIWKGYVDEPRHRWYRMTIRMNGRNPSVWVTDDLNQIRRRVAELVLDAWGFAPESLTSAITTQSFTGRG